MGEPKRVGETRIFVIDEHAIYRRGLVACLRGLEEVDGVADASSVEAGRRDERLQHATLLLIDHDLPGARRLVRELHDDRALLTIICTANQREDALVASLQAGASGFLGKESLTPDKLAASIRAVRSGTGVVTPTLLSAVVNGGARTAETGLSATPADPAFARLNPREQSVLRLIAEGCRTREVAQRLSYSERTIKNVVHDITTKLQVRSRSQAVAEALREGLI